MIKDWFSRPARDKAARLRVLMVCMGNVCRSPMAEALLRHKLRQAGLQAQVLVDSAGTHGFHRGAAADPRAVASAAARGLRLAGLRSRPVEATDFERFDLVLAMDRVNLDELQRRCPAAFKDRLGLILDHAPQLAKREVPDPYYGSAAGFEQVLDLLEPACDGLLISLRQRLSQPA